MEYLLKSKLGAAFAVAYLLPTGYFFYGFAFAGGGPHGEAGTSLIYALFLTLPLSMIVVSIATALKDIESNILPALLFIGGLVVCALINTAVIYFVVGWVSRKIAEYFSRLSHLLNNS